MRRWAFAAGGSPDLARDGHVEALLDEVHRARCAEELEPDLRVAFEKVADDRSEEFGVDGSGHAQEPPGRLLQTAHRALGLFDLSGDPRAVIVVGPAGVRQACGWCGAGVAISTALPARTPSC